MRLGLSLALLLLAAAGCVPVQATHAEQDRDPNRIFTYGQLQWEETRKAFIADGASVERDGESGRTLVLDLTLPDEMLICLEVQETPHQERCVELKSIRRYAAATPPLGLNAKPPLPASR